MAAEIKSSCPVTSDAESGIFPYRGQRLRRREPKGTTRWSRFGQGLYDEGEAVLAREMVRVYNGDAVSSIDPGRGDTFVMFLRGSSDNLRSTRPSEGQRDGGHRLLRRVKSSRTGVIARHRRRGSPAPPGSAPDAAGAAAGTGASIIFTLPAFHVRNRACRCGLTPERLRHRPQF